MQALFLLRLLKQRTPLRMARPKKVGEKKGNISVSVTPSQSGHVKRTALGHGFSSASEYLLALHEAEQRLGLHAKKNFNGQRWFVLSMSDPVPEDITLEQAVQARIDDAMESAPKAAGEQQAKYGGIKVHLGGLVKHETPPNVPPNPAITTGQTPIAGKPRITKPKEPRRKNG
jgi:hypothetical protein